MITQGEINQLNSKNVQTWFEVLINGSSVNEWLPSYSYSFDSSFGSARATINLINPDGIFSKGGSKEINRGDPVEIREVIYVNGSPVSHTKFVGIVEQINPSVTGGKNRISLSCFDEISRLQFLTIPENLRLIESEKTLCLKEEMKPIPLAENEDLASSFYFMRDFEGGSTGRHCRNIAPLPVPFFETRFAQPAGAEVKLDQSFNIDYTRGILTLKTPLPYNTVKLLATFYYYPYETLEALEDGFFTLLTAPDGYGNPGISEDNLKDTIVAGTALAAAAKDLFL